VPAVNRKFPGRVETEGARNRFGRYVSDRRQMTGGGVHGESGDAVMAAIADVKEFPRGVRWIWSRYSVRSTRRAGCWPFARPRAYPSYRRGDRG